MKVDTEKITALAERLALDEALELVDVEIGAEGPRAVIRIYLEREGGIRLGDCESFSRRFSALLEVEDPVPGSYLLEVSSPGLERKLVRPSHFHGCRGRTLKVSLTEFLEGSRNFRGRLLATYDEGTGEFEVLEFRTVVEMVQDKDLEISLEEARKLDPEAILGDAIGFRTSTRDLGRIAAQTARQIIMQKVKDAEREGIYNEFITRKGEIINGIVQRYERDTLVVDLGKTEAVMPPAEQIPRERYRQGDRIRAYIKEVSKTSRGPAILLSRSDPRIILKLFEQEVPEGS